MNSLVWPIILLSIGLVVMVLEVFVPSGGILGFVSVVAIIAAVVMAFVEQGPLVGMLLLSTAVVAVPGVLMIAFRWFPRTPLGRRVLPPPPDASDVLPDSPLRRRVRTMVGRTGRVVREMLPWGSVEIDGATLEAVSETGPIELGAAVEAVGVQGMAVVVRRVEPVGPGEAVPETDGSLGGRPPRSSTLEDFEFDDLTGS